MESNEISRVLRIFKKQILEDSTYILDEKLFKISLKLSLHDWKKIRTKDYYDKVRFQSDYQRKMILYNYIKNYLNNK